MNKKKSILLIWGSLVLLFTSLVFFIIGLNSDYLVKSIFKYVTLVIALISIINLSTNGSTK